MSRWLANSFINYFHSFTVLLDIILKIHSVLNSLSSRFISSLSLGPFIFYGTSSWLDLLISASYTVFVVVDSFMANNIISPDLFRSTKQNTLLDRNEWQTLIVLCLALHRTFAPLILTSLLLFQQTQTIMNAYKGLSWEDAEAIEWEEYWANETLMESERYSSSWASDTLLMKRRVAVNKFLSYCGVQVFLSNHFQCRSRHPAINGISGCLGQSEHWGTLTTFVISVAC